MIEAKVIADSKNEFGDRITTMVVTMPRFILAEFNTHRMFSRNSASSRAIPFKKMIKSVMENPFIPIVWQKDHKGMQGIHYFNEKETNILNTKWLKARDRAVESALDLASGVFDSDEVFKFNEEGDLVTLNEDVISVTKQLVNRLLEAFMYHTVIVTATEWENFFALRCPQYQYNEGSAELSKIFRSRKDLLNFLKEKDELAYLNVSQYNETSWLKLNKGQAEIHMMALAEAMWDALNESTPKQLEAGEWHIPFGDNIVFTNHKQISPSISEEENKHNVIETKVKIATAMCARVSYTVVGEEGKEPSYAKDIELHDRLVQSGHWSPIEHCARAMDFTEYNTIHEGNQKVSDGWSGNFKGFVQYRKTFNNENITK